MSEINFVTTRSVVPIRFVVLSLLLIALLYLASRFIDRPSILPKQIVMPTQSIRTIQMKGFVSRQDHGWLFVENEAGEFVSIHSQQHFAKENCRVIALSHRSAQIACRAQPRHYQLIYPGG